MTSPVQQYLAMAVTALQDAADAQLVAIETAAGWVADAVAADRLIFVTGSGHSHMLAEEVFYRAGGLVPVYPILDPALMLHHAAVASTTLERVEGIAQVRLASANVGNGDVLIVASNSGRNAYPVEAALGGRKLGAMVVALTSLRHAQSVESRHSSGKLLHQVADLVIDTGVLPGDAAVKVSGELPPVGALSTVVGAALINAVMVGAVDRLSQAGMRPPVFRSANVDSEDGQPDLAAWAARIPPLR